MSDSAKKKKKRHRMATRNYLIVTLKLTMQEAEEADELESDGEEEVDSSVVKSSLIKVDTPMIMQIMSWLDDLGPEGATKSMVS